MRFVQLATRGSILIEEEKRKKSQIQRAWFKRRKLATVILLNQKKIYQESLFVFENNMEAV